MIGFLCWGGVPHEWERDPERRGEGLVCAVCHVSEAELEGDREATDDS